MNPSVTIRIAEDAELEDTLRLRWLWTCERGGVAGMTEAEYLAGAARWARAHRSTHVPFVAVDGQGRVVGMAWLALTERVPNVQSLDRWSGDLQSCYVLPELRGSGIGGALVRAVLDEARDRAVEHVTVHTSAGSVAMYSRSGFQPNDRLLWAAGAVAERG